MGTSRLHWVDKVILSKPISCSIRCMYVESQSSEGITVVIRIE